MYKWEIDWFPLSVGLQIALYRFLHNFYHKRNNNFINIDNTGLSFLICGMGTALPALQNTLKHSQSTTSPSDAQLLDAQPKKIKSYTVIFLFHNGKNGLVEISFSKPNQNQ